MTVLQGLGASVTNFLPDSRLMVRNSGQAALISSNFVGASFDLARLASYWSTDIVAAARQILVAIKIESIVTGGPTYTFTLEVDDNAAFTSPTVVSSLVVSETDQPFHLAFTRSSALFADHTIGFLRMKCTASGVSETGSVVFSGAVADNGDTVTISDGVNSTVFTFAASGDAGTGAAVAVATGATPTNSATNLRAAINANLHLVGVTAGGATTTVSVTHAGVGGAITKSDVDNDYIVTNFSGGILSSIAFWAFIRGDNAAK